MPVRSWHGVCLQYLDYNPPALPDESIPTDRPPFLDYLTNLLTNQEDNSIRDRGSESRKEKPCLTEDQIVVGCNCIRVLFPRSWTHGFGPYPPSCFPILNQHNDYRNITPTSIKMFPLSLLRNLSGLYLTNPQQRSGSWLSGSSLMAYHRINALGEHSKGKINLKCSGYEQSRGVIGVVDRSKLFATKNAIVSKREEEGMYYSNEFSNKQQYDCDAGYNMIERLRKEEETRRRQIHQRAVHKASQLTYIRGVEKEVFLNYVADSNQVCTAVSHGIGLL